jgi:hypothetical protein
MEGWALAGYRSSSGCPEHIEGQALTGGDEVKKPLMLYRTTRRHFAELLRDYSGTTQNIADQMIDGCAPRKLRPN